MTLTYGNLLLQIVILFFPCAWTVNSCPKSVSLILGHIFRGHAHISLQWLYSLIEATLLDRCEHVILYSLLVFIFYLSIGPTFQAY